IQLARTVAGMTRIVDGLLALARYEAGIDKPAIEPLDLVAVVRAQVQAQHADATRRGLTFDVVLTAELWVMGDELLIERIVSNLLRNAVLHAPEGDRIGVHSVAGAAGLSLCFENAAPTLTVADIPRLGERHFRAGEASASGGHAGLGLALCTALAEQLDLALAYALIDGRLTVELTGLRALDAAL
ncbi:MAG: sensor histidine kinase, partial [Gammaproteobacteria bacterium]